MNKLQRNNAREPTRNRYVLNPGVGGKGNVGNGGTCCGNACVGVERVNGNNHKVINRQYAVGNHGM